MDLDDSQLPHILDRIHQLEVLDISFNNFRPQTLHNFIIQINRRRNSEMCLSWFSLKGNQMKGKSSFDVQLQRALSDLILKPYLQHLDLGLTNLSSEVVRTCI